MTIKTKLTKILNGTTGVKIRDKLAFYGLVAKEMCCFRFYASQLMRFIIEINFLSLNVVSLTSFFIGAVLTMQTQKALGFMANPDQVAMVVVSAIIREIGPVLTGLIIAGRISSSIAAEIATMKNTDQISALKTLSIDPITFLVTPRIFVGIIFMPLLLLVSNIIAIFGSMIVASRVFDYDSVSYLTAVIKHFSIEDFQVGTVKALLFGFIITLVGTSKGMLADIGSTGVGKAATDAVVTSSIMIILGNYAISSLAFS